MLCDESRSVPPVELDSSDADKRCALIKTQNRICRQPRGARDFALHEAAVSVRESLVADTASLGIDSDEDECGEFAPQRDA
jgi:hypothetical protein